MKRKFYLAVIFSVGLINAWAQDPLFSQFYSAPLYLNPALAGTETNTIVSLNYRSQINGLESPFQTGQLSFIYPLITKSVRPKHLGGLGGSVFSEQSGQNYSFKTTGFIGGGAYNLTLDKWRNNFIAFGLQAGIIQKVFNTNKFNWGSQYNPFISGFDNSIAPTLANVMQTTSFPVINAGVTFFSNSRKLKNNITSFIGFAVSNLNKPNESLIQNASSEVPLLVKIHGGLDFALNDRATIAPQLLWMRQNGLNQINIGAYLSYSLSDEVNPFVATVGSWYRVNDAIIALVGFSKSKFTYGFSYDLNTSSLRNTTLGQSTFEISITYRKPNVKQIRRRSTPLI